MRRKVDIAGLILAGGRGMRMGMQNKAFLRIGLTPTIDHLLAVHRLLFNEVLVSVHNPDDFQEYGVTTALDQFETRSSLTGIHAGLAAAKAGYVFVTACDAPFLRADLVQVLVDETTEETDVVIPRHTDGNMEPLCAIYSKACLPHMAAQLQRGDCKIIRFFDQVRVRFVPVDRLRLADPASLSFVNINTPTELEQARQLASVHGLLG